MQNLKPRPRICILQDLSLCFHILEFEKDRPKLPVDPHFPYSSQFLNFTPYYYRSHYYLKESTMVFIEREW